MAKHFVAVCVVCLLCADHLPCKTHIEGLATGTSAFSSGHGDYLRTEKFSSEVGGDILAVADKGHRHIVHSHTRRKRHSINVHGAAADGENAGELNENSRRYLEKIFERFGNGDQKTMDLTGFESMLEYLGLTNIVTRQEEEDQEVSHQQQFADNRNGSCLTSAEFIRRIAKGEEAAGATDHHHNLHEHGASKISKREVGGTYHSVSSTTNDLLNSGGNGRKAEGGQNSSVISRNATNSSVTRQEESNGRVDSAKKLFAKIDTEDLMNICPILLYQLLTPNNVSCLREDAILAANQPEEVLRLGKEDDRALVWIYASASVLGVSLCGMLGFAVIPCMEKSFYHTMLQFLVALAVGTLAGDALLHLLPHAMILTLETAAPGEEHTAMTLKGLVAVLGVIAFFAIERGLTMITEWRKERQKKQQLPGRVRVMRDPESVSLNNSEKQCKHKYSSYPYCYDEIAMETKDDHHHHHHHHNNHQHNHSHGGEKKGHGSISTTSLGSCQPFKQNSVLPLSTGAKHLDDETHLAFDHSQLNHHDSTGPAMVANNNNGTCAHRSVSKVERLNSTGSNNNTADNNTLSTTLDDGSSIESSRMLKPPVKHEESLTVILREHESKHHGHSHTHGHVHSPPGSLSAVAWMVVMGDGLHNFTDGMAIGAAFSNDIAGGFSTAIAVFCHELPHELGDFAVLLKAGMSAKKAVYYNFLSSILSFFGMVLGICIGDTPEASAWIFAVAAGLFIYIALVDMVPELTSSHHAGSNTVLQVLGMSAGLVIMLLIALNEHDLKSLFAEGDAGHHHHHH